MSKGRLIFTAVFLRPLSLFAIFAVIGLISRL